MSKERFLRTGACICLLWLPSCLLSSQGEFLIINNSKMSIEQMSVEVSDRTYKFANIPPGVQLPGQKYDVRRETDFNVEVIFASGNKLTRRGGYVASGLDLKYEIEVTDTDILIVGKRNSPN